jgi:AcrR family transcriptional regulator
MLCTQSGVTARHFYEEFASREALLRAILDDIAERTYDIVREALRATTLDVHERVLQSNRAYYGYLTQDARRARIYALESLGISVELEQHRRELRERSVRQLTRAAQWNAAGTPPDLDPRLVSIGLSSAAIAILAEWVLAHDKPALEEMAQTLTLIWMRTLRLS